MEINQIIFYVIGIVIPTIFVLFTLGHLVFVTSEYKGITNMVPNVLLLIMYKLIAITFLIIRIYHYVFSDRIEEIVFLIYMFGVYIIFECIILNKLIAHSDKLITFVPNPQNLTNKFIERYMGLKWKALMDCNFFPMVMTYLVMSVLILWLITLIILTPNIFFESLLICLVLILITNYFLTRFLNKL